jgi:hypothetical protein
MEALALLVCCLCSTAALLQGSTFITVKDCCWNAMQSNCCIRSRLGMCVRLMHMP